MHFTPVQDFFFRHRRTVPRIALALILPAVLSSCGGNSDEPSEADFEFTEGEFESAATGTYEGTVEHPDGTTSTVGWTLERLPPAGTATDALELQPQCGGATRDLSASLGETTPLTPTCASIYETTMPVTGTAIGDSVDTTVTGSVSVIGLTLDGEWNWSLELGDGSRLWGYGPDPVVGDWRRGDELLGTFEVTKAP